MALKPRFENPVAQYYVMSRGDRREAIVRDDRDRTKWVKLLGKTCEKMGWKVHAYCLMTHHFHLVLITREGDLVTGMKWFLGVDTMGFNRRHWVVGHLFLRRDKSLLIDEAHPSYLQAACHYVHLNPSKARLIREDEPLSAYAWSSYPEYLKRPAQRPDWLDVGGLFAEEGLREDRAKERRRFERQVEELRGVEVKETWLGAGNMGRKILWNE